MMKFTFLTCAILLSLGVVKAYDIVVAMTNGGPGHVDLDAGLLHHQRLLDAQQHRLRLGGGGDHAADHRWRSSCRWCCSPPGRRAGARRRRNERAIADTPIRGRDGRARASIRAASGASAARRSRSSSSSRMCAAFFCVPLYVVIVTSFKTMDQIRSGEIFALPTHAGPSSPGGRPGTRRLHRASTCDGIKVGLLQLAGDPLPEPRPLDRRSPRSPATRWRSGTCAGRAPSSSSSSSAPSCRSRSS